MSAILRQWYKWRFHCKIRINKISVWGNMIHRNMLNKSYVVFHIQFKKTFFEQLLAQTNYINSNESILICINFRPIMKKGDSLTNCFKINITIIYNKLPLTGWNTNSAQNWVARKIKVKNNAHRRLTWKQQIVTQWQSGLINVWIDKRIENDKQNGRPLFILLLL